MMIADLSRHPTDMLILQERRVSGLSRGTRLRTFNFSPQMSDPFSIAGSAVGIVSLGITCCENLLAFIGHVKDGKNEQAQIRNRMDDLADCLERLQCVVSATQCSSNGVETVVESGITACATALNNIREKMPLSEENSDSRSLSRHFQGWKSRLGYPFRREEILFLKDMIESVQQNLIVALHTLQM
jgi:hypothetical protein